MKITILTLFPEVVEPYLNASILGRAQKKSLVEYSVLDIRTFSEERNEAVDDTPYGGGAGMVMQVGPIYNAVTHAKSRTAGEAHVVLLSAKGGSFTQQKARTFSQKQHLILICGRYEGVDERVASHIADEEISIGDYVLTGGELGAMVIADAVTRLIPGALGNAHSLEEESHMTAGFKAAPQYTKPEMFNEWQVPEVLLSGNHAAIAQWREQQSESQYKEDKD